MKCAEARQICPYAFDADRRMCDLEDAWPSEFVFRRAAQCKPKNGLDHGERNQAVSCGVKARHTRITDPLGCGQSYPPAQSLGDRRSRTSSDRTQYVRRSSLSPCRRRARSRTGSLRSRGRDAPSTATARHLVPSAVPHDRSWSRCAGASNLSISASRSRREVRRSIATRPRRSCGIAIHNDRETSKREGSWSHTNDYSGVTPAI